MDAEEDAPGECGEDSGGRRELGGGSSYPGPKLDVVLGPWLRIRRVTPRFFMDRVSVLLVFCPRNRLPKFGRRVARLARRQSAGDLRKFGERRQRRETG